MQTLILGCRHQKGVAKASGKDYDMRPSLVIGSRLESIDRQGLSILAVGYEAMVVECDPLVFNEVVKVPSNKFPITLDLEIIAVKRGDTASSFVASIRRTQAA